MRDVGVEVTCRGRPLRQAPTTGRSLIEVHHHAYLQARSCARRRARRLDLRGRLAAVARPARQRRLRREEPAGEMERHGERRLEGADRRRRRLVADRLRRSRLRDVADRHRRPPCRQSSAARAGRERRRRRRTRARGGGSAGDDRTFFVVEAFNRADGRRLWQHRVEAAGPLPGVHDKHNLASPSPVTDGQMVYAWFGTGQIVALDMSGKVVWERHLGQGDRAVRDQLGALRARRRSTATRCCCCAITRRRRTCSRSTRRPARSGGRPIAARGGCRTPRRSSSRRRAGRS